jgi:hypothetical protein
MPNIGLSERANQGRRSQTEPPAQATDLLRRRLARAVASAATPEKATPGWWHVHLLVGHGQILTRVFNVPVVAIEPSTGMRSVGTATGFPESAHYISAQAEALPLGDSTCRAAWLSTVVHHLTDIEVCATELRRVLIEGAPVMIRNTFALRTTRWSYSDTSRLLLPWPLLGHCRRGCRDFRRSWVCEQRPHPGARRSLAGSPTASRFRGHNAAHRFGADTDFGCRVRRRARQPRPSDRRGSTPTARRRGSPGAFVERRDITGEEAHNDGPQSQKSDRDRSVLSGPAWGLRADHRACPSSIALRGSYRVNPLRGTVEADPSLSYGLRKSDVWWAPRIAIEPERML